MHFFMRLVSKHLLFDHKKLLVFLLVLTCSASASQAAAPVVNTEGTWTATKCVAFSYQIFASNSPTSYTASGLPPGLTVDPALGGITGIPTTVGAYTVTLGATNSGGTGSATLVLNVTGDVAKGNDIGWLQQMAGSGFDFYDTDGTMKDPDQINNCLKILKERHVDTIRLRVFIPPIVATGWDDELAGNCTIDEVVPVAAKAKALGFRIMISLHYSWTFADPGNQRIPVNWVNQIANNPADKPLDLLAADISANTTQVLTKLKAAGVTPEWISLGNEITNGMLLHVENSGNQPISRTSPNYGSVGPNLAELINAGYSAVKNIDPNIKVVLHIDRAHSDSVDAGFFHSMQNAGAHWDVSATDTSNDLSSAITQTVNDLAATFNQPGQGGDGVLMMEMEPPTIYPNNTYTPYGNFSTEGDFDFVSDITRIMRAVPGGKGLGTIYWEGAADPDWRGYLQAAWENEEPNAILDAFLPSILQTNGLNITDANGAVVQLKGVNLGGCMVMDPAVVATDSSGNFPDEYSTVQELDTRFGVPSEETLVQTYREKWITTTDFNKIKGQGLNVVRIPVWWGDFYPLSALGTASPALRADAFTVLDSLVAQAGARGLYTIIDMQGAFGGQSASANTGYANQNQYWTNATDQADTQLMWSAIAAHYNGNPLVAGYDLLNEPSGAPTNQAVVTQLNNLYTSVRAADPSHIIFMEGTFGSQWGWGALPNPSSEGWTNVVYEMHEYEPNNPTPTSVENGAAAQVTDFNQHASYNVPAYIGEFNAFGTGSAAWQAVVSDFNNANMSWSAWTYKSTATSGKDGWSLYGLTGASPAIPSVATDTSSTISSDWSSWGSTSSFTLSSTSSPALIGPAAIIIVAQATAESGSSFSFQVLANDIPTSYQATNLPSGLTINSTTGLISGTPASVSGPQGNQVYNVALTATTSGGTASGNLRLKVNGTVSGTLAPAFFSATSDTTTVGDLYLYNIQASNVDPSTIKVTSSMPPGLTLVSNSTIEGTPTTAGPYTITFKVTNAAGTANGSLALTVNAAPQLPVISSPLTVSAIAGSPFSYSVTATNSTSIFRVSTLPAGLSINYLGVISGTPSTPGTYPITLSATNTAGTSTATLNLTVTATASSVNTIDLNFSGGADPITGVGAYTGDGLSSPDWNNLTGATSTLLTSNGAAATGVGVSFTDSATFTSVTTPTLFSQFLQALSSSTQTVTLTGLTPNGNYQLYLYGQNGNSKNLGATFSITTGSGSPATGSNASTANVANTGFVKNVNYVVFNVNATTTGTLAIGWTQPLAGGGEGDFNGLQLVPTAGTPAINSAATATGTTGTAFSYTITGNNMPTSYAVVGTLPAGISFNASTGVISGTPTTVGTFTVTLNATNANGTGTETLTFTVNPPAPVISSATTASGAVGSPFSYTITASNSPTSFNATGLPAGLSVNTTTGVITGTPTGTGSSTIALSATNAGGTGTATLTLTVNPASSTTLVWSGSVNSSWDVSTLNWLNGTTPAAYYNGNTVVFDDSGAAGTVAIAGAYSPASVTVNTSTNGYSLAGPGTLTGAMTLTKSGSTTVSLSGANTYTGGTLLLGGEINISASATALGSGTLTLGSAGDTSTVVVRAAAIDPANPITVNAGGTRWIEPGNGAAVNYTGAVTLNGGATLNLSTVGGNITVSGGVTGTGNILLGENGGSRGSSETLSGGAVNNTGTISDASNPDTGGARISAAIGTNVTGITQNSSSEAMTLSGANAFNGPITITTGTLTLGGAGVLGSGAYTGAISDSGTLVFSSTANQTWSGVVSGGGALTDSGTGTLTLSGANTYTGTTTLSAGTLLVNGSVTSPVSVSSGGTLGGTGSITGNVTAASGSGLSFNVTSSGVDGLAITGNLTLNGTITVTPNVVSGSVTPGTYPIVTYSGTLSGTPTFVWNPVGTTLTASINTSTPGVVTLVVNPPPPVINSLATASGPSLSPFSYTITASNSPTSYNATGLPAGLSIDTGTGIISGTPTTAGTSMVTLSATNAGGTGTETLTLTVTPPEPAINSSATFTGTAFSSLNYTITANYGPTSFSATGLPPGLTLNTTTGVISGTTTSIGTFNVTLSATNAYGTGTEALTLTLNPPPTIQWTGTSSLTWDTTTQNWVNGSTATTYADGDYVNFDDSGTGGIISLSGAFSPSTVTVTTSVKGYSLAGSGSLYGPMTLTKNGTTTLSLSGANTFTGGTQLLGGQINISASSTALGTGTLTFGSSGSSDTNTLVVRANSINPANPIAIYSGGTRWIEPGNGNSVNYTGPIVLYGGVTLGMSTVGGNLTLSGGVTGTGNILLGENGGARASKETLSGGTVNMSGTISDAGNPDTGGALISAPIGTNVTGITQGSTSESLTLTGTSPYNGPITISSGTLTVGGTGALGSGTFSGNITNGAALVFSSSTDQTWSGIISGAGTFTDSGAGILMLTGADTYSGATSVASGGVLLVDQSLNSAVTVNSGGALGGSGTIQNNITINSGAELSFNVTSGGVSGLTIQGNIAASGTVYITPTILSGTLNSGTYVIATYSGTLTGSPTFQWLPPQGSSQTATISTATAGKITITVP